MKKLFILPFLFFACQTNPDEQNETVSEPEKVAQSEVNTPDWVKSANIYEVNIRQYSSEGTINEFVKHLPRLQKLGVDILWIMPVQPIGLLNRKESADDHGSFYSIKNYVAVNPDLGNIDDFKTLVNEAHKLGMHVILDWVANHTAWDHDWVSSHPEWYTADSLGNRPIVPIDNEGNPTDWTDVADLNYDNKDMRSEMIKSMTFWLNETGIDGFRCDVAGFIPYDFWNDAYHQLSMLKPEIFMLAEWEDPEILNHFNMDYGWHLHHLMNQVASGKEKPSVFIDYHSEMMGKYQENDMKMFFTTNHDENSWNGTVYERLGKGHLTHFILASTFEKGMPLIYSGQEAGLNHRLSFFGKDSIDWSNEELNDFYQKALALKHDNQALWNAEYGGSTKIVETDNENIIAYYREKEGNIVLVFLNFSESEQSATYDHQDYFTDYLYKDWFNGEKNDIILDGKITIPSNGFLVYTN